MDAAATNFILLNAALTDPRILEQFLDNQQRPGAPGVRVVYLLDGMDPGAQQMVERLLRGSIFLQRNAEVVRTLIRQNAALNDLVRRQNLSPRQVVGLGVLGSPDTLYVLAAAPGATGRMAQPQPFDEPGGRERRQAEPRFNGPGFGLPGRGEERRFEAPGVPPGQGLDGPGRPERRDFAERMVPPGRPFEERRFGGERGAPDRRELPGERGFPEQHGLPDEGRLPGERDFPGRGVPDERAFPPGFPFGGFGDREFERVPPFPPFLDRDFFERWFGEQLPTPGARSFGERGPDGLPRRDPGSPVTPRF